MADLSKLRALHDAGGVIPWRITQALDLGDHQGPEVDVACGAVEPAVDEWEAGTRYPTWVQVLLLARLTGCSPAFFYVDGPNLAGTTIFMCDRQRPSKSIVHVVPQRITEYELEVIRATVGDD